MSSHVCCVVRSKTSPSFPHTLWRRSLIHQNDQTTISESLLTTVGHRSKYLCALGGSQPCTANRHNQNTSIHCSGKCNVHEIVPLASNQRYYNQVADSLLEDGCGDTPTHCADVAQVLVQIYKFECRSSSMSSIRRTAARTLSGDSYQYLERSRLPTYHFQKSLPRLPVPKLEDTCRRYLASIKPIISESEYERTTKLVAEFEKGEGQGVVLEFCCDEKVSI